MPSTSPTDSNWATRLLWTLVGTGLLDWSFRIVSHSPEFGWAVLTAMLAGAWGIGTVLISWLPQLASERTRRYGHLFGWGTALVSVLCFAVWAALFVRSAPAYGTDELAFDQYAAHLFQHGFNPYTHSMAGAFSMFQVSPAGFTYTLTGQRVAQLSYPALSFLLYVPFLLLGWSRQLGVGLDVLGWIISTLLIYKLLARELRPAALLLGTGVAYVQLSVIGLTDMLFMPMLVLAAYRWDRFGSDRRSYIGPVMFGLAMAVKQTPWPVLPFVLMALALDERARTDLQTGARRAGRYLVTVLIAFLIPNLPFIVAAPSAWVHGALTPLIKDLVPAGQGAISFSLFVHIGGGSLVGYSLMMVAVGLLLVVSYWGTYPLLRAATFALPVIAYFFAVRSYTAYLVSLVPPGLVGAITADSQPLRAAGGLFRSPRWRAGIAACAALCVAVAVYTLASPPPLQMTVTQVYTSGANNIAENVVLQVTNNSGGTATPHFTMETSSGVSTFWHVLSGPPRLRAGHTATYLLASPNADSQFTVNDGIAVLAFLTDPNSVSVSNTYMPPLWHVASEPEAVDYLVPLGKTVVLHAQLLNVWNEPIHQAGVPITLNQSQSVGQTLLQIKALKHNRRLASINGGARGRGATVLTNAQGSATFRIVGKAVSPFPVTLSFKIPSGPPFGDQAAASNPVLIRFRAP